MRADWPIVCLALAAPLIAAPPEAIPLSLPHADFAADPGDAWLSASDQGGEFAWDAAAGHAAEGSLRASQTVGWAGWFPGYGALIRVQPGRRFRLAAWVKLDDATGQTYLSLDGYEGSTYKQIIAQSDPRQGSADWHYLTVRATIPEDGDITHLRVGLRSENNQGTAWFDDVTLHRLPPDEPYIDGPPGDPPHGAIAHRDGHLVGEDGRRVRLWGVNLVDELGRSYAEIDQIARRVKQMGFNAVRLHLYDSRLIDTDATNERGEPTTLTFREYERGDGSRMDRFDYCIYRLEREGLYIFLTGDRMRAKYRSGDYDALPPGSDEDRRAWQEAVGEGVGEQLPYVDERLAAAQLRFIEQQMDHVNQYTGRRIADDPYLCFFELTNENGALLSLLGSGHAQWPEYFQAGLRRRFAAFLRKRYSSEDALREAWGKLEEGESLDQATIRFQPTSEKADRYSAARLADVRRCAYELVIGLNRRLEEAIHKSGQIAAGMAVTHNTIFQHKHPWYYVSSQGTGLAVGTYQGGGHTPERTSSTLTRPPELTWYNLDMARVDDKPTVIYENNVHKPAYYRAEYPIRVAALCSWHDWDGVFWYVWSDGTVREQDFPETYVRTGLRYGSAGHIWHGIVICTDEMLLSSLRAAGAAFVNFHLPVAPDPAVVTVGANDLLGRTMWIGDLRLPYPEGGRGKYPHAFSLSSTCLVRGLRFRYSPEAPETSISAPIIARTQNPLAPAPGLTLDWEQGKLIIDTPGAKLAAGFLGGEQKFSDGVEFSGLSPEFAVIGLVSDTPEPLSETDRAVLIATSTGENTGVKFDPERAKGPPENIPGWAKITVSWGTGPIQAQRVSGKLGLGRPWQWTLHDFLLQPLGEGRGETLSLAGEPLFVGRLTAAD